MLLFKWFYDPGAGLFNQILDVFGIPPLAWLDSTSTALISLVIVSTWMNLGTGTLIYLAALQSIPGELYESAELDGAGLFRRVWHVTVPQTKLILLVMLLLQIVATMQVFIEPYLLTGGGPENATVTVAYLMYQYAFNFGDFGGGGALGLMLMVVLMVFSAIYLRVSRDNREVADDNHTGTTNRCSRQPRPRRRSVRTGRRSARAAALRDPHAWSRRCRCGPGTAS